MAAIPECPLARGDRVRSPRGPGGRWHLVRAVRRRWRREGKPARRVFVGYEIVFRGLTTGVRHAVRLRDLEVFGYEVRKKA